jgi:hypothetical protein
MIRIGIRIKTSDILMSSIFVAPIRNACFKFMEDYLIPTKD